MIGLITILIGFVSAISEANIIYFLTGGISGLLFLGFGEIISLLYSICKNLINDKIEGYHCLTARVALFIIATIK